MPRPLVDVLVPTYRRPTALAVLLASLAGQTAGPLRIVVSDQTEDADAAAAPEVRSVVAVLRRLGHEVEIHKHLPRRGLAEQRAFLLDQACAPFCLFVDDDLILEPFVVGALLTALAQEGCGFVGSGCIGPSYAGDVRPGEQAVEFWEGPVRPEVVRYASPEWRRYRLHNAANLLHVERRLGLDRRAPRPYRVAWVGGCVLYRTQALRAVGGFGFWEDLPDEHAGEDVLAQLRVMARFGGCGLLPSGVYHQELSTTVVDRRIDAPVVLWRDGAAEAGRDRVAGAPR